MLLFDTRFMGQTVMTGRTLDGLVTNVSVLNAQRQYASAGTGIHVIDGGEVVADHQIPSCAVLGLHAVTEGFMMQFWDVLVIFGLNKEGTSRTWDASWEMTDHDMHCFFMHSKWDDAGCPSLDLKDQLCWWNRDVDFEQNGHEDLVCSFWCNRVASRSFQTRLSRVRGRTVLFEPPEDFLWDQGFESREPSRRAQPSGFLPALHTAKVLP